MALTVPSGQRQRLSQGLMHAAPEKRPLALKEAARCHLQRLRVNLRSQRALATRLMPPLLRKGRQRPGKRKRGALQASLSPAPSISCCPVGRTIPEISFALVKKVTAYSNPPASAHFHFLPGHPAGDPRPSFLARRLLSH